MNYVESDDWELIRLTGEGKLSAFEELVSRYQHRLLPFVVKRVKDHHVGADIVQEVFIKLFKSPPKKTGQAGSIKPWLYKVAVNTCYDYLRINNKVKRVELREDVPDDGAGLNLERMISEERKSGLMASLMKLPAKSRGLVAALYLDGKSYLDLSRRTGRSVNTIKTQIRRARLQLAKIMTRDEKK